MPPPPLRPSYRRVVAFCDIDPKKVGQPYFSRQAGRHVPVIHFREAVPPIVCCVALDRTDGELEANIASKGCSTDNFVQFS